MLSITLLDWSSSSTRPCRRRVRLRVEVLHHSQILNPPSSSRALMRPQSHLLKLNSFIGSWYNGYDDDSRFSFDIFCMHSVFPSFSVEDTLMSIVNNNDTPFKRVRFSVLHVRSYLSLAMRALAATISRNTLPLRLYLFTRTPIYIILWFDDLYRIKI